LSQHANLTPAQRQDFRAAAHAIFDQLTREAIERFNRHVAGYRFFPDTHQLSLHCVPGYATLPANLQPIFRASGSYNWLTRELELDGSDHFTGVPVSIQDRYTHEFGHAIDGPNYEISDTQDWQVAWRAEIQPNPPNPNASTDQRERFAAFSTMAFGSTAKRTALEQSHPLCVAVWRAHNLW
jgi:hypothetical protein